MPESESREHEGPAAKRSAEGCATLVRAPRVAAFVRRLLGDAVRDVTGDEATLWLVAADGEHVRAVVNVGPSPELVEGHEVELAGSVVGMVATLGHATAMGPDDEHDDSLDRKLAKETVAMVAAPLRWQGVIVGALSVVRVQPAGADRPVALFTLEDVQALEWRSYLLGLVLADASRS